MVDPPVLVKNESDDGLRVVEAKVLLYLDDDAKLIVSFDSSFDSLDSGVLCKVLLSVVYKTRFTSPFSST